MRNDAIESLSEESEDEDDRHKMFYLSSVNLGHALLSRICWSSDESISMICNKWRLDRGCWAGDRFEVTTLSKLRQGIDWKDVSDEVVDTLRGIWVAENGG